jgi:hypothetical protein
MRENGLKIIRKLVVNFQVVDNVSFSFFMIMPQQHVEENGFKWELCASLPHNKLEYNKCRHSLCTVIEPEFRR